MLTQTLRGTTRFGHRVVGIKSDLPGALYITNQFPLDIDTSVQRRYKSDGKGDKGDLKSTPFRPRRLPSREYRPAKTEAKKSKDWSPGNDHKFVTLGNVRGARDELEAEFGPLAADVIRDIQRDRQRSLLESDDDKIEEYLRMADYLTSQEGSTEDLVGERRALERDGLDDPQEREEFLERIEAFVRKQRIENMVTHEEEWQTPLERPQNTSDLFSSTDDAEQESDPDINLLPNQLAHGEWSEMLVTVDRNIKLWRGGRLESYRALVIGGNLNGCGGFGVGKALDPIVAVDVAGRHCKRNIFFVDRYQGNGLTSDLVGKQNSCTVALRATDNGLRGNELCREILKRFGITNCVAKSHGNRNPYNVVRATFKALMTHESLEDIALKRGKRLMSIDRAMRMQV